MTSCSKSIASTASVARAIQGGQKVQRFLGIGQCFDSPLVRSGTLNAFSYLTHWSCSKGNTSPYSKERWRLQQQKKDVRQLQECVNRCCPGRGSAEVSNTYVMVRNFEMRIYLYIYAFFIHFPKVCLTKHARSPFYRCTKRLKKVRRELARTPAGLMQPSHALSRLLHGVRNMFQTTTYCTPDPPRYPLSSAHISFVPCTARAVTYEKQGASQHLMADIVSAFAGIMWPTEHSYCTNAK